jgi:hypothetical protein
MAITRTTSSALGMLLFNLLVNMALAAPATDFHEPGQGGSRNTDVISVCLQSAESVDLLTLGMARSAASRVFAAIDVKIEWCGVGPPRERGAVTITIQFDPEAPPEVSRDAMATAFPYAANGTRIHVFLGRVPSFGGRRAAGEVLGYVMAHEIAHVLERISHHSSAGIMKAHWEAADFSQILFESLSFDPEDVAQIHSALVLIPATP